ncbi:hypothetical protein BD560DRAFT_490349 [Blakeslea trispora]|nr:hypothetical protein BD560DRAFT_490349 [Blakeslea trispora]
MRFITVSLALIAPFLLSSSAATISSRSEVVSKVNVANVDSHHISTNSLERRTVLKALARNQYQKRDGGAMRGLGQSDSIVVKRSEQQDTNVQETDSQDTNGQETDSQDTSNQDTESNDGSSDNVENDSAPQKREEVYTALPEEDQESVNENALNGEAVNPTDN